MENELNRLIELQNQQYEKDFLEKDDDLQSNLDIDDFEQRLKQEKSMMRFGHDDSSDDDVPRPSTTPKKTSNTTTITKTYQPPPKQQTKFLLSDEPDLLRQIQEIDQNKNKSIQKSNSKINTLQNEITKYKQEAKPKTEEDKVLEVLNSNNASLKDKKLKELIQKNKELYVNLEKEKTMRQKLQKDLDRIKEDTDLQIAAMEGKYPKNTSKQDDNTDWRKRYNELEKKLQESKLQNTTLKNDLNKAMRIISREVGDNINIDAILAQENSWKGRAQQIEVLKARMKELQSKTNMSKDFSDVSYVTDKSQSDLAGLTGNGRNTFNMGGKSKERREEIDALKTQIETLKAENETLNEKVKGVSSRKTILEKDMKEVRNDFERSKTLLIEKSENDDRYIAALKKEIEKLRSQPQGGSIQTRIVYRDKPVESKRSEVEELEENLTKKEMIVMKNELERKEKIIKELINEKIRNSSNTINKENAVQENIPDQEKLLKLETMIKILKQENEELTNLKLGVKTTSPDAKLIKDLSLQNAQLRRKLDDLQQKLKPTS